jgi:hypothetical protein
VSRELNSQTIELHNTLESALTELARAHRLLIVSPFRALSASEQAVNLAAQKLLWCCQTPVSYDPAALALLARLRTEIHALASLCTTATQLAGGWAARLDTMLNGYCQREQGSQPQGI